jgi:hypothetical protein
MLGGMHPAALSDEDLLRVCDESRTRRGGPGGQHRNKVETAVVLEHRPSGLRAEANERRSQADNRRVAVLRLRLRLAVEHREPAAASSSACWQARVSDQKLVISEAHRDFPTLLAEALDQLADQEWQPAPAADRLGVSSSQLIRFLKRCPAGMAVVNQERSRRGLRPLK